MPDATFHSSRAAEALVAAEALRADQPAWALVPLFYSAMHLMHARFDEDDLEDAKRHPGQHKSFRDHNGGIVKWGNVDVVRSEYPAHVSRAYSALFSAGFATRYSSPPNGDGARMWDAYANLRTFCSS